MLLQFKTVTASLLNSRLLCYYKSISRQVYYKSYVSYYKSRQNIRLYKFWAIYKPQNGCYFVFEAVLKCISFCFGEKKHQWRGLGRDNDVTTIYTCSLTTKSNQTNKGEKSSKVETKRKHPRILRQKMSGASFRISCYFFGSANSNTRERHEVHIYRN